MYKANKEKVFAVAPMMDWTDRHCRYFHRLMTKRALLYTEMVVADAVLHGNRDYLLGYNVEEHPVALQLGGSEPDKLAKAAAIAVTYGYDEINLNVGCPSDRVQSGTFGACLMREPELVGQCVSAMKEVVDIPVTVKCRIGVDEQNTQEALDSLANQVWSRGADALWVHARKAWLEGLSPKENRDIPPLDYDIVQRMKGLFSNLHISVNGGITSLEQAQGFLDAGLDGVMIGRSAYHAPCDILCTADRVIFGKGTDTTAENVVRAMVPYIDAHIDQGGRLNQITRHMMGLFTGRPGARIWRRMLSEQAHLPGAGSALVLEALETVEAHAIPTPVVM